MEMVSYEVILVLSCGFKQSSIPTDACVCALQDTAPFGGSLDAAQMKGQFCWALHIRAVS
jgi:hypothetical protein